MNKFFSLLILIVVSGQIRAQTSVPQVTVGAGAGVASAFSGTALQKNTLAFYGDAAFYPAPCLNLNIEGEAGSLSGASAGYRNRKSFNNNFEAVTINGELQLGVIIKPDINDFFDVIRNIYGGAGYGVLHGNITNVNVLKPAVTDHIKNTLHIVPLKLGYELNIAKNEYGEPKLKLDGCINLNYVNGEGLDGYYDKNAAPHSFYSYASLGLRYAISLRHGTMKDYNKFD